MQFMDAAPIAHARLTSDGYLVADARIARTGIQVYGGAEVGKPELATVRVYRPEAEVFASDAMTSMAHRPVTNDHPTERVTAHNWRQHSVGMTGGEIARDGHFIRVPMTVMDSATIKAVQSGKRELSVGYTCDLAWEPGTTADGEAYDAVQKNIRGNHLAIVQAGRAGGECRIHHDHTPSDKGARTVATKIITFDGLPVETTDAGEAAINKLKGMLADASSAMEAANKKHTDAVAALMAAHQEALAAKDKEAGMKDAAITELQNKLIPDAKLDQLVADRTATLTRAKAIAPTVDANGKSNAEVRRAAVAAKLGDSAVKDRPDAYIDGLFDHLTADVKPTDPLREAIRDGAPALTGDAKLVSDALAARQARYATGYRNQPAEAAA